MENRQSLITLLTDFGTQDYFVGAMKGAILSISPEVTIVDISHDISPQDIHAAAFNLLSCYKNFPGGTIHVAVVDPGVGSDRRGILIECAGQFFVGPDNGVFSWTCERERKWKAINLTNDRFFHHPISPTFHGRDIFAPVAANLANGAAVSEMGEPLDDIVWLESLQTKQRGDGAIEGRIIHVDRFGNCVTNITADSLPDQVKAIVNNFEIKNTRRFFAEGTTRQDELFIVPGSAGFLEIAAQNSSASAILNARCGQEVTLISFPDN